MTTSKRERDLARQRAARQAQKDAEAASRTKRNRLIGGGILAAALLIGGGAFIVNAVASPGSSTTSPPPAAAQTPGATTTAEPATAKCAAAPAVKTSAATFPNGPDVSRINLVPGHTYGATFDTNCGQIKMEFAADKAPNLTKSMIFLLNTGAPKCVPAGATCNQNDPKSTGTVKQVEGFFDLTKCHRLTTAGIFVLQCGDPKGNGTGGPGFKLPDENLPSGGANNYPRGSVAMANSGPGTNGSQFFIVYKDTTLPPNYSLLGKVVEGLDIVDTVAKAGVKGGGTDGPPNQPLVIKKALSYESYAAGGQ